MSTFFKVIRGTSLSVLPLLLTNIHCLAVAQNALTDMPPSSSIAGELIEPSQSDLPIFPTNPKLFSPTIPNRIPTIPSRIPTINRDFNPKIIRIPNSSLPPVLSRSAEMQSIDTLAEVPKKTISPFSLLEPVQQTDEAKSFRTSVVSFKLTSENVLTVTDGWISNTPKWKDKFANGDMIAVIKRNNQTLDFTIFNDPRIAIASFGKTFGKASSDLNGHNTINYNAGEMILSFGSPVLFSGAVVEIYEISYAFPRGRRLDDKGLPVLLNESKLIAKIDGAVITKILNTAQQ